MPLICIKSKNKWENEWKNSIKFNDSYLFSVISASHEILFSTFILYFLVRIAIL
jgi:hypothetical protein